MNPYDEIMRLYDVSVNQSKENKELKNTIAELKDALEFESRVAKKLADSDFGPSPTSCHPNCTFYEYELCSTYFELKFHHTCYSPWLRLKEARLEVESEMDKE